MVVAYDRCLSSKKSFKARRFLRSQDKIAGITNKILSFLFICKIGLLSKPRQIETEFDGAIKFS